MTSDALKKYCLLQELEIGIETISGYMAEI